MNWFIQRLEQGERAPVLHGLAWFDYSRNQAVSMLLPFNWSAIYLRRLWHRLRIPKWTPSRIDLMTNINRLETELNYKKFESSAYHKRWQDALRRLEVMQRGINPAEGAEDEDAGH